MTPIEEKILAEAHLMLIPQQIRSFKDASLRPDQNTYFMSSGGITRTANGRLWILWAGGGDNCNAYMMMSWSDDNGEHFKEPQFFLKGEKTPGGLNTCIIEGNLFYAPDGTLHLFYCQRLGFVDGRMGVWHAVCKNPEDDTPVWGTPVRISDGSVLDKPIILQDGRWLLEISIWDKGWIGIGPREEDQQGYSDLWEGKLSAPRGANIYLSEDCGETWQFQGSCHPQDREFDEARIVQRKDASLLMLLRTQKGLAWSESFDLGKSWTPSMPADFPAPTARAAFLRLPDNRLLLVRNVPSAKAVASYQQEPDRKFSRFRENMTAFISADEGKSWSEGTLIDGRDNVSYPDVCVSPEGTIHLLYDWQRENGELMYARFTIEDLDAGRPVVPRVLFQGHQ